MGDLVPDEIAVTSLKEVVDSTNLFLKYGEQLEKEGGLKFAIADYNIPDSGTLKEAWDKYLIGEPSLLQSNRYSMKAGIYKCLKHEHSELPEWGNKFSKGRYVKFGSFLGERAQNFKKHMGLSWSDTLGGALALYRPDLIGLSTAYTIIGVAGKKIPLHIEEAGFYSINVCVAGKQHWDVISRDQADAVRTSGGLKEFFKATKINSSCPDAFAHKCLYADTNALRKKGFRVTSFEQNPGEVVLLDSFAYHGGYSVTNTCNVAWGGVGWTWRNQDWPLLYPKLCNCRKDALSLAAIQELCRVSEYMDRAVAVLHKNHAVSIDPNKSAVIAHNKNLEQNLNRNKDLHSGDEDIVSDEDNTKDNPKESILNSYSSQVSRKANQELRYAQKANLILQNELNAATKKILALEVDRQKYFDLYKTVNPQFENEVTEGHEINRTIAASEVKLPMSTAGLEFSNNKDIVLLEENQNNRKEVENPGNVPTESSLIETALSESSTENLNLGCAAMPKTLALDFHEELLRQDKRHEESLKTLLAPFLASVSEKSLKANAEGGGFAASLTSDPKTLFGVDFIENKGLQDFFCTQCKKSYTQDGMKNHMNSTHRFECPECGEVFENSKQRNNHKLSHAKGGGLCRFCQKYDNANRVYLENHQRERCPIVRCLVEKGVIKSLNNSSIQACSDEEIAKHRLVNDSSTALKISKVHQNNESFGKMKRKSAGLLNTRRAKRKSVLHVSDDSNELDLD